MFKIKLPGKADFTKSILPVQILIAKKSEVNEFCPRAPWIKYLQDDENTFCSSSNVSALFDYA